MFPTLGNRVPHRLGILFPVLGNRVPEWQESVFLYVQLDLVNAV